MVEVSIVIPTKNDDETLRQCLESIDNLSYPADRRETIIVDGHSTDDTVAIAREFGYDVVFEEKGTISHAREVGVDHADGDSIAFTDADCVVPEDWIDQLLEPFSDPEYENLDIAAVGGPNVTPDDDSSFAKAVGDVLVFLSNAGARYGYSGEEIREIYHNPTCNVLYRRTVLKQVDGFNDDLVTVDDEEMDFRIRNEGYSIMFTPHAEVQHYRRPTWLRFARMAYRYGYGRAQAIRLHPEMGRWFHVAPSVALAVFVLALLTGLVSPMALWIAGGLVALAILGVASMGIYLGVSKTAHRVPVYTALITEWLLVWAIGMIAGTLHGGPTGTAGQP